MINAHSLLKVNKCTLVLPNSFNLVLRLHPCTPVTCGVQLSCSADSHGICIRLPAKFSQCQNSLFAVAGKGKILRFGVFSIELSTLAVSRDTWQCGPLILQQFSLSLSLWTLVCCIDELVCETYTLSPSKRTHSWIPWLFVSFWDGHCFH